MGLVSSYVFCFSVMGEIRTLKGLLPLAPKASAYTSSATMTNGLSNFTVRTQGVE